MSRRSFIGASAMGLAASIACGTVAAVGEERARRIDLAKGGIGMPPADFEFALTGEGESGRWTVVRDPTAETGIAIEHVSIDPHEDRFPLAIYQPLTAENVELSARLKIVSGISQTAGLAFGVRNPASYYAVSLNAFEHRADLILFSGRTSKRLDGAEAETGRDRWHALRVTVNDDHFAIALDGKVLFTAFDRARMKDGRVALWTQEDNVTRFDRIEVRVLPPTEWRR
ncbi:MAG: hypothetical protein C5B56_08255 [Proteobacteria bacterium]|nr:MAG: hypothetical protein C5B56_08255 [Pseudomonadota bacterium]